MPQRNEFIEDVLNKKFEFWNEATTMTRYFYVFMAGIMAYSFQMDVRVFAFILVVMINFFCCYKMKSILNELIQIKKQ